jgi:biotin operon repressor
MAKCMHGLDESTCYDCAHPVAEQPTRGRPMMRDEWAKVIKSWLPAIGDDWITGDELADASGLTRQQVSAAIAYLRDNDPEFPLVSGPEGYRFSIEGADVNRYRFSATRTAHTRIRRAWRGVVKPWLETANLDPVRARNITRSFERLLEDLQDLIEGEES